MPIRGENSGLHEGGGEQAEDGSATPPGFPEGSPGRTAPAPNRLLIG